MKSYFHMYVVSTFSVPPTNGNSKRLADKMATAPGTIPLHYNIEITKGKEKIVINVERWRTEKIARSRYGLHVVKICQLSFLFEFRIDPDSKKSYFVIFLIDVFLISNRSEANVVFTKIFCRILSTHRWRKCCVSPSAGIKKKLSRDLIRSKIKIIKSRLSETGVKIFCEIILIIRKCSSSSTFFGSVNCWRFSSTTSLWRCWALCSISVIIIPISLVEELTFWICFSHSSKESQHHV